MVNLRREFDASLQAHAEKMAEIGALIDYPATAVDKAISKQFKKSTKDYNNLLTADEIQGIKNAFGLA